MGNRNARIGGYRNGRTHPRHNLKWDTGLCQRQSLFSSTSEDERVTTLQSHYRMALLCIVNEQRVNLLLLHAMATWPFADIHTFCLGAYRVKQLGTDQAIVD